LGRGKLKDEAGRKGKDISRLYLTAQVLLTLGCFLAVVHWIVVSRNSQIFTLGPRKMDPRMNKSPAPERCRGLGSSSKLIPVILHHVSAVSNKLIMQGKAMMMRRWTLISAFIFLAFTNPVRGQSIREAVVKKSPAPPLIDGRLTEPQWQAAAFTEKFVKYQDGGAMLLTTQANFLWDDGYLYVGFVCEDPDVWATLKNRDDHLWEGEVVEILCDPDGDGRNYFEIQVNPLGTVLDLLMNKPYSEGGNADLSWTVTGLRTAVHVAGTLNNAADSDTLWSCEAALPFDELAFMAPSMAFPPAAGDSWRILVTRYDYERSDDRTVEISSWNQTDSRGFHVPEKFGRIVFSNETATAVNAEDGVNLRAGRPGMPAAYPNPFNASTTVVFDLAVPSIVTIGILDLRGRELAVLADGPMDSGRHWRRWDGTDGSGNPAASGVYLVKVRAGKELWSRKIQLSR
jgi:hypothetical protein